MHPRRAVLVLLLTLLFTPFLLADPDQKADEKTDKKAELETTLRKLEKDIEKVRGLAFKKPVVAHIIPRPADKGKGLQGYYSTKEKALYVYDDIKGNYERGVLIHEMVHALQDQHFGLDKLHQAGFGSDGEMARAALIEGDATLTMIELLKKDQPRAGMMLESPLEKSRNLQNAFLYAQGARYVKALKEKGGWASVNTRYRFPPSSTASILHPGEFISVVDLGPGTAKGEYGLIELLQASPATAADSVKAASGWRGDRTVEEKDGTGWVVAFATKEQATLFRDTLARLRMAQAGDAKPDKREHDSLVWKSDKGLRLVRLRDRRVLEVTAANEKGLTTLVERMIGPPSVTVWSAKEKKELTFGELIDRLLGADLVCVGETHDSELHHQVQLQIIRSLFARDDRLGVGLEMFQRPYQKHLDRYVTGATSEEAMLEDTEYHSRWGFEWSLYKPILDFCKRNSVPVAALNAPRELTQKISKVGVADLSDDEKKQLGDVDFQVKGHRAYWFERLAKMHGDTKVPEDRKERSYQVMTVWDGYMANSAARFQKERGLRRLVILAGSGHIDRGFGIPERAAKQTGGKAVTVHIATKGDRKDPEKEAPADFVVVIR